MTSKILCMMTFPLERRARVYANAELQISDFEFRIADLAPTHHPEKEDLSALDGKFEIRNSNYSWPPRTSCSRLDRSGTPVLVFFSSWSVRRASVAAS
jgi:hypothetical protein